MLLAREPVCFSYSDFEDTCMHIPDCEKAHPDACYLCVAETEEEYFDVSFPRLKNTAQTKLHQMLTATDVSNFVCHLNTLSTLCLGN